MSEVSLLDVLVANAPATVLSIAVLALAYFIKELGSRLNPRP